MLINKKPKICLMKCEFKISFKAQVFLTLEIDQPEEIFFENSKIIFNLTDKGRGIEGASVFLKSDSFDSAEEQAKEIVKNLNNLCFYYSNSFLLSEAIDRDNPTKNLTNGLCLNSSSMAMTSNLERSLRLDFLEKHRKYKDREQLDKLLSVFGNSERVHGKESKFLCLYKIINNFGSKSHIEVHRWLYLNKEWKVKPKSRLNKNTGKKEEKAWPVVLRDEIAYDENPIIKGEDLENMRKYARRYVEEKVSRSCENTN